jgi:hypothetical protein
MANQRRQRSSLTLRRWRLETLCGNNEKQSRYVMSIFYVLRNPKSNETEYVTDFLIPEPYFFGDPIFCSSCDKPITSKEWLSPFKAEIELWGKGFGDIAFGSGENLLVSEDFKSAFLKSGLKGIYEFAPVEIVKISHRKKKNPPTYYCININYSKAAIDYKASGFEYDNNPPTCTECRSGHIKRIRRVIIENGTWSGEDIFLARGLPGTYIVSEKFYKMCNKFEIKNALCIPAEQYSFDFYPWERPNN